MTARMKLSKVLRRRPTTVTNVHLARALLLQAVLEGDYDEDRAVVMFEALDGIERHLRRYGAPGAR